MSSRLVSESLATVRASKHESRHAMKRSAVAVVLDSDHFERASVLMIQRAKSDSDPWSGHMAFPGGRQEDTDGSALETAKREMREEVGFNIDGDTRENNAGHVVGRLSDISVPKIVGPEMVVSPYVFLVDDRPVLTPNYEVADTVWIPLQYFADLANRSSRTFLRGTANVEMPCYRYSDDKVVWGMTLKMIDELLEHMGQPMPPWDRLV